MPRKLLPALFALLVSSPLHANGIVGVLKVHFDRVWGFGGKRVYVFVADEARVRELYRRISADRDVLCLDVDGSPYWVRVRRDPGRLVIEGEWIGRGERIRISARGDE